MRRCTFHWLAVLSILLVTGRALAQQHSVPIGPQSGYDPFHWNSYSGRWDYVPIPYDAEPPGANYNPYRFNWHSGRWDYVPFPLLSDYDALRRNTDASTYVDTRLDLQQLSPRTLTTPQPAPPLPMTMVPPPINPHVQPSRPTTRPATTPARPPTSREQELARLRSLGRWEFNYVTGRWSFVLPADQ
jgi:hypothetical protein